MFQKAQRTKVPLKIALMGPSNSGKTFGALTLACAIADGGKVAVIDSEHQRTDYYADKFDFEKVDICAPYLVETYLAPLREAIDGGYSVCVIDSLTHAWDGDGGIMQRKTQEESSSPRANSFALWGKYKKEWKELVEAILAAPIDIVCTARAKMDYVQEGGKVTKVGMGVVAEPGLEYEFPLVFSINQDHTYTTEHGMGKDNTDLFRGVSGKKLDATVGAKLLQWRSGGSEATARPAYTAATESKEEEQVDDTHRKRYFAAAKEAGLPGYNDDKTKEQHRKFVSGVIGVPTTSLKELTEDQWKAAADAMQERADKKKAP